MNRATQIFRTIGLALAISSAVFFSAAAWAGEFFEKDGVAMRGYDVVSYFTDKKPVQGSADLKFEYKGAIFYFSSKPRAVRPAVWWVLRVWHGGRLQGRN